MLPKKFRRVKFGNPLPNFIPSCHLLPLWNMKIYILQYLFIWTKIYAFLPTKLVISWVRRGFEMMNLSEKFGESIFGVLNELGPFLISRAQLNMLMFTFEKVSFFTLNRFYFTKIDRYYMYPAYWKISW